MNPALIAAALLAALAGAVIGWLAAATRKRSGSDITPQYLSQLLRDESDRIKQHSDELSRAVRQELAENLRGFQEGNLKVFRELSDSLGSDVRGFGDRLDKGMKQIDDRAAAIGVKLDQDLARMGEDSVKNRDALRGLIELKLDEAGSKQATWAKDLREELTNSLQTLGSRVAESVAQLGENQKERLELVTSAVSTLTEKQERTQEGLRQAVESRLDAIRTESAAKLDEMRKTVDEKLQSTLETRLGESFNRVVEQLERVHKGIGEMQSLAAGVGDLKRLLSNVRVRGTFGEVQLEALLEQFLSPEQFAKSVQVKEDSLERVEFAVRLPGRDADGEVLLPIDAKFPREDYERLIAAAEAGDAQAVNAASENLEAGIRQSARMIREKYIAPPRTTEFAILFVPTEGLYAEILRRPGVFEQIQREYHVAITGPSTLTAFLNALQMGFKSLAIEKRSSEVWQILGAVSNEFGKYNKVVETLSKQLSTAAKSVENLGMRTRVMNRKLRDVEKLPDEAALALIGPALEEAEETAPENEDSPISS